MCLVMKRGFTLIEIMVAVVITAVLAVVALPKFFGHVAKAKAAEVPIAASAYMTLQTGFISETSSIGSWAQIGYEAPESKNFSYIPGCFNEQYPIEDFNGTAIGWQAQNLVGLNSCQVGNTWAVSVISNNPKAPDYGRVVSVAECGSLTHGWNVGAIQVGDCTPPSKPASSSSDAPESSASNSGSGEGTGSTSSSSAAPVSSSMPAVSSAVSSSSSAKSSSSVSSSSVSSSSSTQSSSSIKCNNGSNDKNNCGNGQIKSSSSKNNSGSGGTTIGGGGSGSTGGGNGGGNSGNGGSNQNDNATIGQPIHVILGKDNQPLNYDEVPDMVCTEYAGKSSNCKKTISKDKCNIYDTKEKKCTDFSN